MSKLSVMVINNGISDSFVFSKMSTTYIRICPLARIYNTNTFVNFNDVDFQLNDDDGTISATHTSLVRYMHNYVHVVEDFPQMSSMIIVLYICGSVYPV